jgi:hypothetical protein
MRLAKNLVYRGVIQLALGSEYPLNSVYYLDTAINAIGIKEFHHNGETSGI